MIGNARDAETILDYSLKAALFEDMAHEFRATGAVNLFKAPAMPEGWAELGRGCYRVAYLSPDNIVYKVEHEYGAGWGQSNYDEYRNILRIVRMNIRMEGVRLPKATLFQLYGNPVMAMEYVESDGELCDGWSCMHADECDSITVDMIGRKFGLQDMHVDNIAYIPKQKEYVLLDLGM